MELLKTQDIAFELGLSFFTVQKYIQAGELPGRKLGGTWITTDRELKDYMDGKDAYEIKLVQLFDVKSAAEFLDIDVPTTRRMIRAGKLKGKSIDNRGSGVGTQVFTLKQVKAAKKHASAFVGAKSGRPVSDNIDEYIYEVKAAGTGHILYTIRDTYNRDHQNYAYRHLHQARGRARQAHLAQPVYKEGEKIEIYLEKYPEGERCHEAFIEHDVTPICRSVLVKIVHPGNELDHEEFLIPVPNGILGRIEKEKDKENC